MWDTDYFVLLDGIKTSLILYEWKIPSLFEQEIMYFYAEIVN